MEENFNPVARTRANYYTPGSPVQFVCVELLRGDVSGENAVCLTFKNISRVTLTALEVHFKCKGVDGVILCEDQFEYRDIEVKPGELFGMDDAVFITSKAITSVDVSLVNVYNGKRVVHLKDIKRVRLSAPRRLSPELQKALESRMNRTGLKYQPQVFENGWYCACGAFHPKEEDTVYCTECRCDRILLQNALNTLLQPEQPARPAAEVPAQPAAAEEPTRIVGAAPAGEEPTRVVSAPRSPAEEVEPFELRREPLEDAEEHTRVLDASTRAAFPGSSADEGTRVIPAPSRRAEPVQEVPDDDLDEEDDRDSVAEALIRWVPPITAIVCAAVALCGFVYYQFMLEKNAERRRRKACATSAFSAQEGKRRPLCRTKHCRLHLRSRPNATRSAAACCAGTGSRSRAATVWTRCCGTLPSARRKARTITTGCRT